MDDVQAVMDEFTRVVDSTKREFLRTEKKAKKKSWMTYEILDLMEQRRALKDSEDEEYKKVQTQIRMTIREAKEGKQWRDVRK